MEKRGKSPRYNGHNRRKGVKAHSAVSSEGLPLSILIGPGNEHDSQRFEQVMAGIYKYRYCAAKDKA
ncbi:MAG: transposase [Methanothrix sp.]|nr:transposase [Methanothrix sp.]